MAGLKVFVDTFSQPCRAVLILLEANKIPYETHIVKIAKGKCDIKIDGVLLTVLADYPPGEHLSDEYKKINFMRKVPAIDDDGFKLAER